MFPIGFAVTLFFTFVHNFYSSLCYMFVSNIPGVQFSPWLYVDEDAVNHFLDSSQDDLNKLIIPIPEKNMIWDNEAKERFQSSTHCHICEKQLINQMMSSYVTTVILLGAFVELRMITVIYSIKSIIAGTNCL